MSTPSIPAFSSYYSTSSSSSTDASPRALPLLSINGGDRQPIETYLVDSDEMMRLRVAARQRSAPRWMTFAYGRTSDGRRTIDVVDALDVVRARNELRFRLDDVAALRLSVSVDEAFKVFVATNVAVASADDDAKPALLLAIKNMYDDAIKNARARSIRRLPEYTNADVDGVWRSRRDVERALADEIASIARESNDFDAYARQIERLPEAPFTQPEIDRVNFTLDFGEFDPTTSSTIAEIFDAMTMTTAVPYASMTRGGTTVYKVHRDFVPPVDWLDLGGTDIVVLKPVSTVRTIADDRWGAVGEPADVGGMASKQQRGTTAVEFANSALAIRPIDDDVAASAHRHPHLLVTIDVKYGASYASKETIVSRVVDVLSPPIGSGRLTVRREHESAVVSYFTLPSRCLSLDVFSDLAMNDRLFSTVIAIDEFARASKKKPDAFLHLKPTGDVVSAFNAFTTSRYEYGMRKLGEPYVRCRARTKSVDGIAFVQRLVARLMTAYDSKRAAVVGAYRVYDATFATAEDARCVALLARKPHAVVLAADVGEESSSAAAPAATGSRKPTLRELAPDIFEATYSRQCNHPPSVLADGVAESTLGDDRAIMHFPTKGESPPRTYYCDSPEFPYPGLLKNVLANKDRFPYVPCCYQRDQRTQPKSNYHKYFERAPTATTTTTSASGEGTSSVGAGAVRERHVQQIYTTTKILLPGVVGVLPKRVQDFFAIVDMENPGFQFIRKGVTRSPYSFVECAMLAKGLVAPAHAAAKIDADDATRARVIEERDRILRAMDDGTPSPFLIAAKQELYDESDDAARRRAIDGDMRASLFVRAVETALRCNVFVFGPGADGQGEMVVPRHEKAYLRYNPTVRNETIFVYEHFGSEADRATYPQCELIVKASLDDPGRSAHVTSFSTIDPVVVRTYARFLALTKFVENGVTVAKVFNPVSTSANVVAQKIDDYGKCRALNVRASDATFTILTEPIPPLAVPIAVDMYRCVDANQLRALFDDETTRRSASAFVGRALWKRVRATDGRAREIGLKIAGDTINGVLLVDLHDDDSDDALAAIPLNESELEYESFVVDRFADNEIYAFGKRKQLARVMTAYGTRAMARRVTNGRATTFDDAARESFRVPTDVAGTIARLVNAGSADDEYVRSALSRSRFLDDSPFVVDGNAVVVPDAEVWRRLVSSVRATAKYSPDQFAAYATAVAIPDYYRSFFPFAHSQRNQYVVSGARALEAIIRVNDDADDNGGADDAPSKAPTTTTTTRYRPRRRGVISNVVLASRTEPYSFRNPLVLSGALCVAQNVAFLPIAQAVVRAWATLGYNAVGTPELDEYVREDAVDSPADVTLMTFINATDANVVVEGTLGDVGAVLGHPVDGETIAYVAVMRVS